MGVAFNAPDPVPSGFGRPAPVPPARSASFRLAAGIPQPRPANIRATDHATNYRVLLWTPGSNARNRL